MKKKTISFSAILICCSFLVSSCARNHHDFTPDRLEQNRTEDNLQLTQKADESCLDVMFVDVGQADCEIIKLPNGENMLIDAGNCSDADAIESYLKLMNITEINYIIATHPHEDHIGGMAEIIESYKTDCIYMTDATANTHAFENLITTIIKHDKNSGLGL